MAKLSRILSGIQPTGVPHLGNYLGALRSWVDAQSENECMPMIADLHALTVPQVPNDLITNTRTLTVALMAMGIDTNKSILFRQSRISQHAELAWIFFCRTPVGWVKRMHQWKTKTGTHDATEGDMIPSLNIGLLSYPVLQAADIMLYKATKVPVGDDQSQHLNLAADICQSFNGHYMKNVFPVPRGGKHCS
jgi:tryptophanyl-tRNA synthetase